MPEPKSRNARKVAAVATLGIGLLTTVHFSNNALYNRSKSESFRNEAHNYNMKAGLLLRNGMYDLTKLARSPEAITLSQEERNEAAKAFLAKKQEEIKGFEELAYGAKAKTVEFSRKTIKDVVLAVICGTAGLLGAFLIWPGKPKETPRSLLIAKNRVIRYQLRD